MAVFVSVWFVFHYNEFVESPDTRYDLGFSFMYLLAVDVILNMLFLIYVLVKKSKWHARAKLSGVLQAKTCY